MTIFAGTGGDDHLTGTDGDDTFDISAGGDDTVYGGDGNDTIKAGAALTSSDRIDGEAGTDTLVLSGDYSAGVWLGTSTLRNVEKLILAAGHSYVLDTSDATVAAGATLTVNASALGASDSLVFNGGYETDGKFTITGGFGNDSLAGGAGDDRLKGGAGNDKLNISKGGNDIVYAGGGNDTIVAGAALTASDRIDGGDGTDTLMLDGDYSAGVKFGSSTLTNVEKLILAAGHSYKLATNNTTVAAGATLTVNASALGASDWLNFNGGCETDGSFTITGGAGNDTLTGGAGADRIGGGGGADTLDISKGGADIVYGGDGNDTIIAGAALTAGDRIDGGGGTDTLSLDGDYSAGVTFATNTLTNVENLTLAAGHTYILKTSDGTVASGAMLNVDASTLGATSFLLFNGGAETDGAFTITGGAGNDSLTSGAGNDRLCGRSGNDTLDIAAGGNDTVYGGDGNDTIVAGAALTTSDRIDGGDGTDTLMLNGDYSVSVTLGSGTLTNVEILEVAAGHTYKLKMNDNNVAAGRTLTVSASQLGAADTLDIDGSAETDGSFTITSGAGDDWLTGGARDDTLSGGAGNDRLDISKGGNDAVYAGTGNDMIIAGAALTTSDRIDGGDGTDTLTLNGDYSGAKALTFGPTTIVNVEGVDLAPGHGYTLTTADATVAAGATLTVNASALGPSDQFVFDGAAETDGRFVISAGAGNSTLTGGAGDDILNLGDGLAAADASALAPPADDSGAGTPIDVFLIAGQSNAQGLADKADAQANSPVPAAGTAFQYENGSIVAAVDPIGPASDTFKSSNYGSAWPAFADAYYKATGRRVCFVPCAFGGTAVTPNGAAKTTNWSPTGKLRGAAVADTNAALAALTAAGYAPSLCGVLWDQGEADGKCINASPPVQTQADYVCELQDLIAYFRANLGAALPFYIFKIGTEGRSCDVGFSEIRDALETVAAADPLYTRVVFDFALDYQTRVGMIQKDLTHYTQCGYNTMGLVGALNIAGVGAGADKVACGAGNDTVNCGAALTVADSIDGGDGNDTVNLDGDYSAGLAFSPTTLVNVETLTLGAGFDYKLTTADATVGAGRTLTVDASALCASNSLVFDGALETDGAFAITGGAGNDSLAGGAGDDFILGAGGADVLSGGAGADTFVYQGAADSTGTDYDTITDFDAAADKLMLWTTTGVVDTAVGSGTLSAATFDADLAGAVNSARLAAGDAVLFAPDAGNLAGSTFLIVDTNGTAGYQAGSDLVIRLVAPRNLSDMAGAIVPDAQGCG